MNNLEVNLAKKMLNIKGLNIQCYKITWRQLHVCKCNGRSNTVNSIYCTV